MDIRERVRSDIVSKKLDECVEKAIYNQAITRCKSNGVACNWSNVAFVESYKSVALYVIRNSDSIKKLIESGVEENDAIAKKPYEIRPEIWKTLVEQKKERDAAYGRKPEANTSMYQCRKCKSRECHYYELQTRSGDEPSTLFITCLACGNRWRMEG